MEKASELLNKAQTTLEKYRKNKTLVSPADLAGKYKVPFQNLKRQLASELSDYLMAYSLEGLELVQDDYYTEFHESVNRIYSESDIGSRVGRAAFSAFDIAQVEQIAEELRSRIYDEAWVPYFHRHTYLYITEDCFSQNNPQLPKAYNILVDKFWNETTGEWIRDGAAMKPAVLIFIQEGNYEQK